jgi:hypothetical protein
MFELAADRRPVAFASLNPVRAVFFLGWVGLDAGRMGDAVSEALRIFLVDGGESVGQR